MDTPRVLSTIGLLLAVGAAGCSALTDFHSARTLAPGETQVGLEANVFGVVDTDGAAGLPSGAVTSRHGISEGFELGLRMGSMGAEVTGKWLLADGDVVLAAAPSFTGFILGPETWWAGVRAPLLIELPFGDGHGVVFSPRAQVQYVGTDDFFGSGGGQLLVTNAGAGVALALRLGPIALVPEVALAYPFLAVNVDGETAEQAPLLFQGGLGARWHFDAE